VLQRDGANLVAAVRLASEDGVLVLRTMVVAEGSQRRGIGARLLQRASRAIGDRESYCIARSYLESFYGRAGFRPITAEALPLHLRVRLGDGLIAMRREARR